MRNYHFIGIGGIGMGALASLMLAKGCQVSGSDLKDNSMIDRLKAQGARIFYGHDSRHIEGADYVIFSSAIREDNCELIAARVKNIPVLKRAMLLAELMRGYEAITVSGAHGKTTTTSMLAQLLIMANFDPTTAVGGIILGTSSHAQLGEGEYFVAELDESDGSFLYFDPRYSVITNIDFEHIDYYKNWDNICNAYRQFIEKTTSDGMIFAFGDDARLMGLLRESGRVFQTFGFSDGCDIQGVNIGTASFDCLVNGNNMGRIELSVPGRHNIANALACIIVGLNLGIKFNVIQESLYQYLGVKRRFQVKGTVRDVCVVDDYAHHPTEIQTTLATAQQWKKQRLITIFQPHRFSRLAALQKEFAQSLLNTDELIVTDIYAASEMPIEGISAKNFVEQMRSLTDKLVVYLPQEEIVDELCNRVESGDLLLTLGAGDITRISDQLVLSLKSSCEAVAL